MIKVGDLVTFKGDTCDSVGNPGVGTVLQVLDRGRENPLISAEVHWPNISMINWQIEKNLEVISETK